MKRILAWIGLALTVVFFVLVILSCFPYPVREPITGIGHGHGLGLQFYVYSLLVMLLAHWCYLVDSIIQLVKNRRLLDIAGLVMVLACPVVCLFFGGTFVWWSECIWVCYVIGIFVWHIFLIRNEEPKAWRRKHIHTYLFDFDGTLVDSMPTFVSSMLRILDEEGITYGDDIVKIITPLGLEGTANYFVSLGINKPKEQIMKTMGEYMLDAYEHRIPAKKYVRTTLELLKIKGVRLNVLTASPHITLDPCLKRLGLYDLFDNVWSCDDFGTTKADPEIYKMAAQRMGVSVEEVLFLDDNLNADMTAKTAGMKVCGVYDDSSKDYVEEMKQATDYYIYDFRQLQDLELDK